MSFPMLDHISLTNQSICHSDFVRGAKQLNNKTYEKIGLELTLIDFIGLIWQGELASFFYHFIIIFVDEFQPKL